MDVALSLQANRAKIAAHNEAYCVQRVTDTHLPRLLWRMHPKHHHLAVQAQLYCLVFRAAADPLQGLPAPTSRSFTENSDIHSTSSSLICSLV